MTQLNPTKEQVRDYLERRQAEHKPPPTLYEIRNQIGWSLSVPGADATDIHWTSWGIMFFAPIFFLVHCGRILAVMLLPCD